MTLLAAPSSGGRSSALPAGDGRGRAGRRQEPARARSSSPTSSERPELVRWRQGRCLPYGEGIAFWALGEIVKAQAGILESDPPEEAAAKLERALPADDPDRALAAGAPGAARRRRRRAGLAGGVVHCVAAVPASRWPTTGPTVLVFEDLHWADEALLAFLEHLADWAEGVPLLVVCTARPELYERHPTWAARAQERDAHQPGPALRRGDRPARSPRCSSERCCRRRRSERCSSGRAATRCTRRSSCACSPTGAARARSVDDVPFPESVQALIAARLDTLPRAQEPAAGRRRGRQGVLGGRGRGDGRSRPARGRAGAARAGAKELVRPARLLDGGRGRVRLLARARPGRLLRADPARRPRGPAPRGRRVDRAEGGRPGRGPRRGARPPLPAGARARSGRRRRREETRGAGGRRAATWCWPASARSAWTSSAPKRAWRARSSSLRPVTRSAPPAERWAQAAQQQGGLQEARAALEQALALYREQGDERSGRAGADRARDRPIELGDPTARSDRGGGRAAGDAAARARARRRIRASWRAHEVLFSASRRRSRRPSGRSQLAAELRLPEPARALGFRGTARAAARRA